MFSFLEAFLVGGEVSGIWILTVASAIIFDSIENNVYMLLFMTFGVSVLQEKFHSTGKAQKNYIYEIIDRMHYKYTDKLLDAMKSTNGKIKVQLNMLWRLRRGVKKVNTRGRRRGSLG